MMKKNNQVLMKAVLALLMMASCKSVCAGEWPTVTLPTFPTITSTNTFDITSYGASTSAADNTAAIQSALNAAKTAGGGKVVIPEGTFLTGPVKMGSNT